MACFVDSSSKAATATTKSAAWSAAVQSGPSGWSRTGFDSTRISEVELAGLEGVADAGRVLARLDGRVAGAGPGDAARLAQAAAVGLLGDLEQAGALAVGELERLGEAQERRGGAGGVGVAQEALAEDDHDVALAAEVGDPVDLLAVGRSPEVSSPATAAASSATKRAPSRGA